MSEVTEEILEQLAEIGEELKGAFFHLAGLVAGMPPSVHEASDEDLEEDVDAVTEVRTATLCLMNDHLRPLVRGLLTLAGRQPGVADQAVIETFERMFINEPGGTPIGAVRDGEPPAGEGGGVEGR